jgi:hypothetical protein
MFPAALLPTDTLPLPLSHGSVHVPLCRARFTAYSGQDNPHTFGGKDLLLVDGKPQFAEVAILRAFQGSGWQGRWLETYGNGMMTPGLWNAWHPDGPRAQEQLPITDAWVNERLQAIAAENGNSFSGCWDVVAWKNDRLVFAESKKRKKDAMRGTQLRWLEAALRCGCALEDFLVVEWALPPRMTPSTILGL